jgi:hypothetical protein
MTGPRRLRQVLDLDRGELDRNGGRFTIGIAKQRDRHR